MPSVSKAQQGFFGFLKSHPKEADKRGISAKTVDEFASTPTKNLPERAPKAHKGGFDKLKK